MKKIKASTKPYIFNIPDVKEIRIQLFYPVEKDGRFLDRYKYSIMKNIMGSSSKKYNEIDLFIKEINKNLIIYYKFGIVKYKNRFFIEVHYSFPKEGLIEDYDIENAFKLLYEVLYNPDVTGRKFNKKNFDWFKDILMNRLIQEANTIYDVADEEIDNLFDPDSKYFVHKKDRIELLKATTQENVYEYYEKTIKNNKFISFIFGAIDDKDKILRLFNKYFKQKEYEFNLDVDINWLIPFNSYREKTIRTEYNQSVIYQIYQVEGMNEKDSDSLRMLYFFLNSSENALIISTLRLKHNLVYETLVEHYSYWGLLYIRVLMDKKDKDLITKLIQDAIYSIRDEEVFDRCKKNLMRALKYDLLDEEDFDYHKVSCRMNKMLKMDLDVSSLMKKMEKISYEQMKEFLDRFKLSNNLFLEGGHNEENV